MKNIFYFGHCWADNIGNAFIDYGVNYTINKVIDNDEIQFHNISNMQPYNDFNFNYRFPYNFLSGGRKKKNNKFDLRQNVNPDLIILGGSLFDIFWCKVHRDFLGWLVKEQYPVFVLGGGGGNRYTKKELEFVSNYWKKINFVALASRDEKVFENFGQFADRTHNGIDNAFFLNDTFKPAELDLDPYVINTFDLTKTKEVDYKNLDIIKLAHRQLDVDSFKAFLKHWLGMFNTVKKYDYISDYPDDYLHLYSNTEVTFSDRVHACVATLIYGGKAQYYDESDRSYLFDRVGLSDIRKKPIKLNMDFIENEKENQLNFVKQVLDEYLQG